MNGGRPQVLLVDDDHGNRVVCSIALDGLGFDVVTASEGFDVVTASEGMEALAVLDEYTPDVIMLDLRMPGMDGWQFLAHYGGTVPVVIVSAWWDDRDLPGSPFAVISKPADMREVAVILRQATRSQRR